MTQVKGTEPGLSRRSFLRAVGISGGAGTMFAAMGALGLAPTQDATAAPAFAAPRASDFHLTGRSPATVVILGGGVAGLVSAYELGKAGYDCTILEPRSRTGGRNFTAHAGTEQTDLFGNTQVATFGEGQYMNCGPPRLAQWMVTLDYCRELGVSIEVFTNNNADAYIYNESKGMKPGHPMRYRTAKFRRLRLCQRTSGEGHFPGSPGQAAHRRGQTAVAGLPGGLGLDWQRVAKLRLHRQHQPRIQRVPGRVRDPRHRAGTGAERVGGLRLGGGHVLLPRVPV